MGTWLNEDGLYIKYDRNAAEMGKAHEFRNDGPYHVMEMVLDDLTELTTTAAIIDDNATLPKNARIEKVEVVTETAVTSGGSAELDVGLIRTDRSTSYDDDGLVAALAIASFNAAGETQLLTAGATGAGALVGTTLANAGLLVASYNTAAFTAGKVVVRVYYRFISVVD